MHQNAAAGMKQYRTRAPALDACACVVHFWMGECNQIDACADANKEREKNSVSNQLLCGVRALVRVIALSDCLNNATAV